MASYVQRACDSIAGFRQRYEKFSKLLTIRQYAPGTILNYCSKIVYVCLVYNKLPEALSEEDIRDYLSSSLTRQPTPGVSQFVHVGIGLRCYYQSMGFPSKKIYIPSMRKRKKLPVVLSGKEMWQLLRQTSDYREKLMLTLLYGLGLRLLELCRLEVSDMDLERCRTASLGGHVDACPSCGHMHISYNSCRNRHYPLCQGTQRERWVEARSREVVSVKYFHVVFTVPDTLNGLFLSSQKEMYSLLFKTAWQTIDRFSRTHGLQCGMTSLLHTWGSNLHLHPHLHCMVPAGGLMRKVNGKNCPGPTMTLRIFFPSKPCRRCSGLSLWQP
jgi:hypothetical protein